MQTNGRAELVETSLSLTVCLPPPLSFLSVGSNKLSTLPAGAFSGLNALQYVVFNCNVNHIYTLLQMCVLQCTHTLSLTTCIDFSCEQMHIGMWTMISFVCMQMYACIQSACIQMISYSKIRTNIFWCDMRTNTLHHRQMFSLLIMHVYLYDLCGCWCVCIRLSHLFMSYYACTQTDTPKQNTHTHAHALVVRVWRRVWV